MAKVLSPETLVDVPRVRHRVDFNLSSELYGWLEQACRSLGLVHLEDSRPRLAELVRVLLVSALHERRSVRLRTALALYSHVVLGLSEQLSLLVAGLRDEITVLVAEATGTRTGGAPRELQPRRGTPRTSGTLTLVLDDRLHDDLSARLAAVGAPPFVRGRADRRREPPPDIRLIRGLLEGAVASYPRHRPVVEVYTARVRSLRAQIRHAVLLQKDAIAEMLREPSDSE